MFITKKRYTLTAISHVQAQTVQQKVMALIPEDLKTDKAYINLARATHTTAYMKMHNNNMRKYMQFRKVQKASVLINEKPTVIENAISDFFAEGCSNTNGYKRIIFATLKKFYEQNDVILNWKKLSNQIGPPNNSDNRAYRRDEIAILLERADPRGKVIVLLLASTGMRIGAIAPLNFGDLQALQTKEGRKAYAITVYRGEREQYVTFCTPECARAVDNYIAFRRRIHENVGNASPLIRNDVDVDTAESNPDFRIAKRVKDGGVRAILENISKASGLKATLNKRLTSDAGTRYEAHLSRAFRKFYYQAMKRAKVDFVDRHALMGHKKGVSSVDMAELGMIYGTSEQPELFDVYQRAIEYLTVDKTERMAREQEIMKQELEEAKVTRKEFEELKAELFREMDDNRGIRRKKSATLDRILEYQKWKQENWTPEEIEDEKRSIAEVIDEQEAEAKRLSEMDP